MIEIELEEGENDLIKIANINNLDCDYKEGYLTFNIHAVMTFKKSWEVEERYDYSVENKRIEIENLKCFNSDDEEIDFNVDEAAIYVISQIKLEY
jgi:hypothetical protein